MTIKLPFLAGFMKRATSNKGGDPSKNSGDVPGAVHLGAAAAIESLPDQEPGAPIGYEMPVPWRPTMADPFPSTRGTYSNRHEWVPPAGLGDAPQQVWKTYQLAFQSIIGPGDVPFGELSTFQPPPVMSPYRATLFGKPIDGASYLMRALSNPISLTAPAGIGSGSR